MRGDAYVLCAVVPWKSENEKKEGKGREKGKAMYARVHVLYFKQIHVLVGFVPWSVQ